MAVGAVDSNAIKLAVRGAEIYALQIFAARQTCDVYAADDCGWVNAAATNERVAADKAENFDWQPLRFTVDEIVHHYDVRVGAVIGPDRGTSGGDANACHAFNRE